MVFKINSNKMKLVTDNLNLTKIGSSLAQGKLSASTFQQRNISLNEENDALSSLYTNSSSPIFLASSKTPINGTKANIYEQVDDTNKIYIGRVFSPFNVSRDDKRPFREKYDFMIAISGASKIEADE